MVQLEKVDVIGVQTPQALLTGVLDESGCPDFRPAAQVRVDLGFVEVVSGFGRNDDVVPPPAERTRKHTLPVALGVGVSRIEVRDAHIEGPAKQVERVLLGDVTVVIRRQGAKWNADLGYG